jgi:hypothetical protein
MYTMKNSVDRNDSCTPPAMVHKSVNSIKSVVGARGYRNGGEPFHVGKMFGKHSIWGWENILGHPAWDLKDGTHLHYVMTFITVRSE